MASWLQSGDTSMHGLPQPPTIEPADACTRWLLRGEDELYLLPQFLHAARASELFATLRAELAWRSERIVTYGRAVPVPRRVCWYGDPGAVYRYSGVAHQPLPWTPTLTALRQRIEATCARTFNSVLGNLYRDGQDSMGWHADNEPELGPAPVIASLSLGAERLFKLRHTRRGATLDITLPDGSLLVMGGELQRHWRHSLPKTRRALGGRINLTFRYVTPSSL